MLLRSLIALSLLLAACSSARAQPDGFRAECAALPATRPSGFVIRHAIHSYRAPEALARFTLYDASTPCPADEMPGHMLISYRPRVCVPLSASALDALYALLRVQHIEALRTRATRPIPHRAGASVTLAWGRTECAVGDVLHSLEMHPADRAAFRTIDEAIRAAVRRAARE